MQCVVNKEKNIYLLSNIYKLYESRNRRAIQGCLPEYSKKHIFISISLSREPLSSSSQNWMRDNRVCARCWKRSVCCCCCATRICTSIFFRLFNLARECKCRIYDNLPLARSMTNFISRRRLECSRACELITFVIWIQCENSARKSCEKNQLLLSSILHS